MFLPESPLGPTLAPGGPVGLKAGGLPGQTDGLPLGNRVRVGLRGPGQDNEADRTEDRWMKG